MKYMLVAGEASGDLHASNLISSLKKLDAEAEFRFFGGDMMAKVARRNPEVHYDKMNVMGFSEVLRRMPRLLKNLGVAKRLIRDYRPDVLILVDYPSFNLKLAKYAHSLGVRVDYFISPKVWAWKEFRVKKIKKYVSNLYSILPFEVSFFQRHGYKVTYVGNPSVQEMDYALGHLPPRRHFVERQGLEDSDKEIIALLPGSRRSEIRNNLPLMIAAAKRFPEFQYVVAAAPSVPEKFYREVAQDPGLQLAFGATPTLLKYAKAAVVTSGTATLETALIGTPQVVCYRGNGSKLTYKIMDKLLKVKYVSLPNLIVSNSVVPELLLHECTPASIARELSPLLQQSPRREWQVSGYKNLRRRLGNSIATDYVAELITDSLGMAVNASQARQPKAKEKNGNKSASSNSAGKTNKDKTPRPSGTEPKATQSEQKANRPAPRANQPEQKTNRQEPRDKQSGQKPDRQEPRAKQQEQKANRPEPREKQSGQKPDRQESKTVRQDTNVGELSPRRVGSDRQEDVSNEAGTPKKQYRQRRYRRPRPAQNDGE